MQIINRKNALTGGFLLDSRRNSPLFWAKVGFFLLFFNFLICSHLVESKDIVWQVQERLSWEEQDELKLLFRNLFAENELGYTLFGDKPMSFCFPPTALITISTQENVFKVYAKGAHPLFNALKAWDKIKELTENENYIFITHEKNGFPESVFLINKSRFCCVVNENIDVFRKVYGSKVTAESFLKDLQDKKIGLKEFLQQHLLIGILLGYGRHNAELFQRREVLLMGKNQIPFSIIQKPAKPFSTTDEELEFLDNLLQPICTKNSLLLLVKPVNFVADPRFPETRLLQTRYESLHKELTALFLCENWFQLILEKLCS